MSNFASEKSNDVAFSPPVMYIPHSSYWGKLHFKLKEEKAVFIYTVHV